jgi:hypothetical protein
MPRQSSGALLTGLLFDDRGNRMSPSFTVKNQVRYRFYVSSALLKGRKAEAGSVPRVSAPEIETAVFKSVRASFDCNGFSSVQCAEQHLRRVVLNKRHLAITLKNADGVETAIIEIPFTNRHSGNRTEINETAATEITRAINPLLIQAIIRAHNWLKSLSDGTYRSIEDLARHFDLHPKVIRKGLRLAFLSPAITKGVLIGEQRGARLLRELDQAAALSWHEQSQILYR